MSDYVYPSNDLERGRTLLSTLGSFWSSLYEGSDQVLSYVRGRALVEQQARLNFLETAAAVSRETVPVFHKENWSLVRAKESEMSTADGAFLAFGDGAIFGNQPDGYEYKYDVAREGRFAITVPTDMVRAPVIMNRITDPSLSMTEGVDYVFIPERAILVFRESPFDNVLIEKVPIWTDGDITDYEIFLWVFQSEHDHKYIYDHFAYVIGARLGSSEHARDVLNNVMDAIVGGTAKQQVETALSAMTGIPLVREVVETVEVIDQDAVHLLIITDKHVYKFPLTTTATVSVGDEVTAGQSLVNAFSFHEFNRGQLPSDMQALALPPGYLASQFLGGIQFENKDVDLDVAAGAPPIAYQIGAVPSALSDFSTEGFTQYVDVFGVNVLATAGVGYTQIHRAVNVLAQYLDNDASGAVDNRLVVDTLIQQGATLLITVDEDEAAALNDDAWTAAGYGATQFLYSGEINPDDGFDAALEEILHLISQYGYAEAYPDVFGEVQGSTVADLMDTARGGYLATVPESYAAAAWYHYSDTTCDYACQITEYFYWVLTSILGIQADRGDQIHPEWELPTAAKVKAGDPGAYTLFTDPQYKLPTVAPNGNYSSHTRVSFDVGGFPLDVEEFFDEIHRRGVVKNQTLAHLLDTRTNKVGEPTALNLPDQINPLEFIAENVLRGNVFVVRVDANALGTGAAGLQHVQLLRKVIPPHTAMLLLIDLQGFEDSVTMGADDERLGIFYGIYSPLEDSISAPEDTNRMSARAISRTCQEAGETPC